MSFNLVNAVNAGSSIPEEFNTVIEIPSQSPPVKYEVNKETNLLFVDRFLSTSMIYPCNYGYIPQTLSEDGDPVDVLLITPIPLIYGCVIRSRPIGMLKMTDEAGVDTKILALPIKKLTREYDTIESYEDLPKTILEKIEHFFEHYKDLEKGKWVKVSGWGNIQEAKNEIIAGVNRYNHS